MTTRLPLNGGDGTAPNAERPGRHEGDRGACAPGQAGAVGQGRDYRTTVRRTVSVPAPVTSRAT